MAATSPGKGAVRAALASACGVLGITGAAARATEVGTAVLGYTEPNRVSALEAIADAVHDFANGRTVNFHLVFDALTGASANGATPASYTQTFTRPSGSGGYVAGPGETPLDDTFRDTRVAVSAGAGTPLDRMSTLNGGVYFSTEHDYTSLGVNAGLARDFNKRNTTLAVRAAYFDDTINPEGGRPVPLSNMEAATGEGGDDKAGPDKAYLDGDGSKQTLDLSASLTQVVDKKTVAYFGYTHSDVSGYQTDPYKIVSLVDPVTGEPTPQTNPQGPLPYLYESRPDARTKHVFYTRLVRALGRTNLQLSYRYTTDDWGIGSDMVEGRWRWNLGSGAYLQPHVRWYHQSAADFYKRYLVEGEPLPTHVSADYRLGDMTTWTFGMMYGRPLAQDRELTARLEYYMQTGESHPAGAFGVLRNYDLFPTVDAIILQVGFNFSL